MMRLARMTLKGTVLAVILVACVALGSARNARAAADVTIASLDCDGEPQVVELANSGDEPQDLAGWELRSDPVADQSYDLTPIGALAPGSSVFIESGPGAEATFTWSTEDTFRSGDPDDFARLVDDQGSTVSEVACAAGVQTTSTPAPTPAKVPPPTPTAAPADGVPDGGGPPAADAGTLMTPLTAVAAGASLASAGGLTLLALWLGGAVTAVRRREPVVFDLPPPPPPPMPRATRRRSQATSEPLIVTMVVALCAAIVVALILPSAGRRK